MMLIGPGRRVPDADVLFLYFGARATGCGRAVNVYDSPLPSMTQTQKKRVEWQ